MNIKITFLGAAQNVTGSRYLVETNNVKFLVDCGFYQEHALLGRNWETLPIPPRTLDAVLLTHAHVDHCGLLPKLVKDGFCGPVYCTAATADIAEIMLLDTAHLLKEDVEFKKKRHEREGRRGLYPEIPLYEVKDVEATMPLFSPIKYEQAVEIGDGVEAIFYDAGHVLGAATIVIKVQQGGEVRTIIFSGDVGRQGKPILRDPTLLHEADYVLVESTYGDRLHESQGDMVAKLAEVINKTATAGGNIVIPVFALERTQEILYYLNKLLLANLIPHLMVFVDSPMAVRVTEVFERYPELFDEDMIELLRKRESPFDFSGLNLVRTVEQSKAINHIKGTVIIMAGSGMCTGGRVKHHLVDNISRRQSTILFVGYQANGTLGRQIVDGAKKVRIFGQKHNVRARVAQLSGFSAHADRDELLEWLGGIKRPPRRLFVVHGEQDTAKQFADLVKSKIGWEAMAPAYKDTVILD